MSESETSREETEELLLRLLSRNPNIDSESTRVNGKTLMVYLDDTSNRYMEKHQTEYLSGKIPWEVKSLLKNGIIDIKRFQFTLQHHKGSRDGERAYTCFLQCSVVWDNAMEKNRSFWRMNVSYP